MMSQVKWGLSLLALGLVLLVVAPKLVGLVYGVPLALVGLALIVFRSREGFIEKVK